MKLQFKHQKFQADAARAVCDVFAGQPYLTSSYGMGQTGIAETVGWRNQPLVPELTDSRILERIQQLQRRGQIPPSPALEGRFNLTVEMETGVGKTYTYIKTMFELNKRYGWSKFIIVVPSIAIREGVYKSLQVTQEHFSEEYHQKAWFFIYNSAHLAEIDRFATSSAISVMIINAQAFNARGRDARRISMHLDEFRSRRPIDIIAETNPILIIDEPQSVEGRQTKEKLREFNPLFTLRYSATPRDKYNLIYRLDAMEAYNKKLVKKIAVKGICESGFTATGGYVYLQSVNLSKDAPTATIEFDCRGAKGMRRVVRTVGEGFRLYEKSGELDQYRDRYIIKHIDGRDSSIEFLNGMKLFAGDVIGRVSEDQLRRIQIRETILSHIERERRLFHRGVKVLSLFFIDEVAKYRLYDEAGQSVNGPYAEIFEEEYAQVVGNLQIAMGDDAYIRYLSGIEAKKTHAGYFSVDRKGRAVDSRFANRREQTSDDADAYDLIMKNKERLLDRSEPVRFIFSHSALREGWDNPNVFQICTLKRSGSDVRKRQEVGRGLRLCVDQFGERMDAAVLGEDVQDVNTLTVIAGESYDAFARGLQSEMAEAVADRPKLVTAELFKNRIIRDADGSEQAVDMETALAIYEGLISEGYVRRGVLTDRFFEDRKNGCVAIAPEAADCAADVIAILESVYDPRVFLPENARTGSVEPAVIRERLESPEFALLWSRISLRSAYAVDFDPEDLIRMSIAALNRSLRVSRIYFKVETGAMESIESREALTGARAFTRHSGGSQELRAASDGCVRYDLIGRIAAQTGLTRRACAAILAGVQPAVFGQFAHNPEEFIIRAAAIINEQKAAAIIRHIRYLPLEESFSMEILTRPAPKGQLGVNALRTRKHLYDYLIYDSDNERNFAMDLDACEDVIVYAKLPKLYHISTPLGRYSPDWAIALRGADGRQICIAAETKGSMEASQLRIIEEAKTHCAREHFRAVAPDGVRYAVVDSLRSLMDIIRSEGEGV